MVFKMGSIFANVRLFLLGEVPFMRCRYSLLKGLLVFVCLLTGFVGVKCDAHVAGGRRQHQQHKQCAERDLPEWRRRPPCASARRLFLGPSAGW